MPGLKVSAIDRPGLTLWYALVLQTGLNYLIFDLLLNPYDFECFQFPFFLVKNSKSISLRELAKIAGVSPATVSLALRESPKLPQTTIDRIHQIAKDHGYLRNPELSRVLAETVSSRYKQTEEVIACIITRHSREEWDSRKVEYLAMCERANEYGYKVEPFWFLEKGLSAKRANQILWSRGISGLVVLPPPYSLWKDGSLTLPLDWEKFSVVEVDDTITDPVSHRVRHGHLAGIWLAIQELEKLGYRRIGLCLEKKVEFATHHRWTAGYVYWDKIRGQRLEPLICEAYRADEIRSWIQKNRLDAVLSPGVEMLPHLRSMGIGVPDELGYASLDLHGPEAKNVAGINQDRENMYCLAIDLLCTLLQRRVSGVPQKPTCWTSGFSWEKGGTCMTQRNPSEIPLIENVIFDSANTVLV